MARWTCRYAAYGSNLHPMRIQERTPSARLLGPGLLEGFGLRFHKRSVDGSAKCNVAAHGDGVHVAVYEMSSDDKRLLDAIEGVGRGYASGTVDVSEFGACAIYIAELSHIDETLRPYDWYRDLVVLGCREMNFPANYHDRIVALATTTDPDQKRSELNRRLVDRIRNGT